MRLGKILVLGGLGFLGRNTVKTLIRGGYSVRVFDRRVPNEREIITMFGTSDNIDFIAGDFLDRKVILEALTGCDACIHLITTTLPATSNADKIYDVSSNLIGSLQVLESMRELEVGKLVFLSSGGTVYGNPIYTPIDENHPTHPRSSYGIVKLAIEKYCHLYNELHNMKAVVLRLSNPYGAGQLGTGIQGAIPVFVHRALTEEPIEVWGDGNVVRDYVHINDVSAAIASAVEYRGDETLFNIGSGSGRSLNQIVGSIEQALERKVSVNYRPARSLDVSVSVLDITKAMTEFNWKPKVTLESGILTVIEDQRLALQMSGN
ncbi:NAD-dependent epimerase [Ochrobactrum sp. POC9]|uniref:NAD-dependent epimerase/dehydratase family protein n=1 Tax=Ochrobactrum sp. POC9 TaxID=2203419 RepID=UPI000D7070CD|nr:MULTISPECIES: NAD-dependent epimerase/dehydratase family protein [Brucella/Ochrobactrum group]PWU72792.1 NAD-dependent epimerase [Ochrobactrum sp. POC9]